MVKKQAPFPIYHVKKRAVPSCAQGMENFKKILRPGAVEVWKNPGKGYAPLFVTVKYEDGRLSLTGVEGPRSNGDAWGSCGQCVEALAPGRLKECAPLWDRAMVKRLRGTWEEWHLNDMRAGCVHQRAAGWEDARIDPEELPDSRVNRDKGGLLAIWVYKKEHAAGLLCKPCPSCGYKYGSAWLKEEVPAGVLEWLRALPDADMVPAWA